MSAPVRRPHPHDDTFFDKVEVELVERWKTSGMSGDEWRFSWRVRAIRKGRVLAERWCGAKDVAISLAAFALAVGWELIGFHESNPDWELVEPWTDDCERGICCQPGCPNKATVRYKMKKEYDRSCFFEKDLDEGYVVYREFCKKHAERGDCGLDDGENNYEILT